METQSRCVRLVKESNMSRVCRMCGSNSFKEVINFGESPLVNSLIEFEDANKEEPTYPLVVHQCQYCFLVQIVDPIDSHKIYQDVDYLYFSSDMPGLFEYFRKFADEVHNKYIKAGDFVVEIGSNDGIWLKNYTHFTPVLGVEPATNVALRAIKNGVPTINQFFTERVAKQIEKEYGKAKVIMGANCIAHLNDLHDMMRGVKALLKDDGVFIVECNYWGGMVKNTNYALIYHDHFSYFTIGVWNKFLESYGLCVFDAEVTPAQGGSLRMYIGNYPVTERCLALIKEEEDTKLNSYETCLSYRDQCMAKAANLKTLINELKAQGKKIAGYGAAAKGFSLLQLAGITTELDYFVDDSPAKQGKLTPVNHIPVISREEAQSKLPDYFFITAPNYAGVIMKKEKHSGVRFILEDGTVK